MAERDTFKLVRKGAAATKPSELRPPVEMLDKVDDGTLVEGPDGVQWIAMPALSRRWERAKRKVSKSATVTPSS